MSLPTRLLLGLGLYVCLVGAARTDQAPSHVSVEQTESGWQLRRDGEVYIVNGAGGDQSLQALKDAGGNSIRLWDFADAGPIMDEAHRLGLTVTLGIWLGHERHGFDYRDEAQLAVQLERVREAVITYRDHPALLIWGLGNEMEGFADGDNPAIWQAVNDAAKLVKSLDPHHPTMTVTADIGGERVRFVHEVCDAIDIHGINSYGGAPSLPARLEQAGARKPYLVTEFGSNGAWEVPLTDWGAPIEPTSGEKAASYAAAYRANEATSDSDSLGSYAFTWGSKIEITDTWMGMFLRDGSRLAAVDTMQELWSGQPPDNRAPALSALDLGDSNRFQPGEVIIARTSASDPDDDTATVDWRLLPESGELVTGGDARPIPPPIEVSINASTAGTAKIELPDTPGNYRLYATAYDGRGNAATANAPLQVIGEPRTYFPLSVYHEDLAGMPWVPSGWMGETDALTLADSSAAYDGDRAMQIRFTGRAWAGIAWQHPANDWGTQPGGFDLTGAKRLELWARGEYGGEQVTFGVGLLEDDVAYPDSGKRQTKSIELSDQWQRYEVSLRGLDLSRIKTGFVVTLTGRQTAVTIYLDKIRFTR
ncbi:MAG: glycoside hydrolase family 2 TIM barrel-domain containing protein [Pseudomonadota bacterium]